MKNLWLFLCLLFLISLPVVASANDLSFNQERYDSLEGSQKDLYKLVTQGIEGLPLGSSSEEIINKMGEPDYRKITHHTESIRYYDTFQFRAVVFQLRDKQLQSILFLCPNGPLSKTTHSAVKHLFGKPEKHNFGSSRIIYTDTSSSQTQTVSLGWSNIFFIERISPLNHIVIGDVSDKKLLLWSAGPLLGYLTHSLNHASEHDEAPDPALG